MNTEEPPPAVREHLQDECETEEGTPTENTHQEEEEQSEMHIHSPAGTEAAPECGGDASPGEEAPPCVMEEAAMRSDLQEHFYSMFSVTVINSEHPQLSETFS